MLNSQGVFVHAWEQAPSEPSVQDAVTGHRALCVAAEAALSAAAAAQGALLTSAVSYEKIKEGCFFLSLSLQVICFRCLCKRSTIHIILHIHSLQGMKRK